MSTEADAKRQLLCDKLEEYLKKVLAEDNENIEDDIENLRAILISADCQQIRQVAGKVELEYVFRRFITLPGMTESLESAITMFIGALDPTELIAKYDKLIIDEALNQRVSSQEGIAIWQLKVLRPLISSPEGFQKLLQLPSLPSLLERSLELLLSPTTKVSTAASQLIFNYARDNYRQLFSPPLLTSMTNVQNFLDQPPEMFPFPKADNDVVRVRFFEIFADIASISEDHMRMLSETNGMAFVKNFDMKFMNDPLVGMNLLKILTGSVVQEHLRRHLQTSGILQAFVDKIQASNLDDPIDMLLLPSFYNFVITYGVYEPKFLSDNSKLLDLLFGFLDSSNSETTICLALNSVGFMASANASSKVLLASFDVHFLAPLTILIDDSRENVQSTALETLQKLFVLDPKWDSSASEVPQSFFDTLNMENFLVAKLTKYVLEPFQHIRLAAMDIIRTLVSFEWGQKAMCDEKKFREWLLNRKTESNSKGREAKWKIVEAISGSKFVRKNFEGKEYLALREYLKSGPVEPQVMEMGNSSGQ